MIVAVFVPSVLFARWAVRNVRRNLHPDSRNEGTTHDLVLDYPRKAALYSVVPLAFFGAVYLMLTIIGVLLFEEGDAVIGLVLNASVAGIALSGSVWTIFGLRNANFVLNSTGIGKRKPGQRTFFVKWEDIREVRMSVPVPNSFVLVTTAGKRRIPIFLNGMADFASMIATKVPRERWGNRVERTVERLVKGAYW